MSVDTRTIRQQLEEREREILAPQASKSADTKGRVRKETEDAIRPAFQRDRDRIIHTRRFGVSNTNPGVFCADGRSLPHAAGTRWRWRKSRARS